jgi:hypothetical protein
MNENASTCSEENWIRLQTLAAFLTRQSALPGTLPRGDLGVRRRTPTAMDGSETNPRVAGREEGLKQTLIKLKGADVAEE